MFMDSETPSDDRPNIQIDDVVRPMTDEEYAVWIAQPKFDLNGGQQ